MKRPDVVVVGAGTAGCVTARRCAEMGLLTLLLDRKPYNLVGEKVCGDEVSKSHFDAIGLDYPQGDQVSCPISGADVYPPSLTNEMRVRGWSDFDGWTINRVRFGQKLLEDAIGSGVRFESDCHVAEPVVSEDQVVGLVYRGLEDQEPKTVKAKLVIDASGFAGVMRNKIDSPLVEKHVEKEDVALCYREIIKLNMQLAEPEVARVFLGRTAAPNGYAWIFPKGPEVVNAGVGICGGVGQGSPKAHFESFRKDYPLFYGCEVLEGAGGAVPVRRPLKSLVANGIAFVGDAALQVNPIHGGGIGPGMRAGIILGEVAKEAIAKRDTSAVGLWRYNVRFQSGFGKRLASLQIFRRLLQQVRDEELDFGFQSRMLEPSDLIAANQGDALSIGVVGRLRRLKRGARRIGLLLKVQRAANLMKRMDKLYSRYPGSPAELDRWNQAVLDCLSQADFTS